MRAIWILIFLTLGMQTLSAQNCPADSGELTTPSSLQGTIAYHHELRDWIGLKLQQPACGQNEIQLTFSDTAGYKHAETLRGCSVAVTGSLDESPTGYYSTDFFIVDSYIEPAPNCQPQPPIVYPSASKIPASIKSYSVTATIPADNEPIRIRARRTDQDKAFLSPGEAYIQTRLTGGYVLYALCANGFTTTSFFIVENGKRSSLQSVSADEEADLFAAITMIDGSVPGNSITLSCRRK
ncbi:MAG TPA: hypothetical protein VNU94_08110 [Acidobacteriaceae bacterium]|jgi:hypothetical protein|nr:hypothetical protein [Acidobacteriaceae bacterium]